MSPPDIAMLVANVTDILAGSPAVGGSTSNLGRSVNVAFPRDLTGVTMSGKFLFLIAKVICFEFL